MKKILLVFLAVFAALFVFITLNKKNPAATSIKEDSNAYTALEKENLNKFWAYYREATDYRMDDQWEQAAENYLHALDYNERHEDALYYLGNMYLELNRYKEAERCWLNLLEVNPKNSRAYLQLGTLYLGNETFFDIDKAERACRKSLDINKEETGPVLLLGEVYLIRGQLEVAASYFDAVTASNFKSTEAYFLGGYIAWKKGDVKQATSLFRKAVDYAKPPEKSSGQVEGEGDTRQNKGFGSVTSKSVFQGFMAQLSTVQPDQADHARQEAYNNLDVFLADLKRKVH